MNKSLPLPWITAICVFTLLPTGQATVLLDNGFNLGLSEAANLHGVAVSATGFTGNYTVNNTTQNGSVATVRYTTAGLSFGSYFHAVSGGAAVLTTSTANTANPATARLEASVGAVATGTIYSSYLIQIDGAVSTGNFSNSILTIGAMRTYTNKGNGTFTGNKGGVGVFSGTENITLGNFNPVSGTTYLALSRYTNIGVAAAVSVSDLWILTQGQYDNWFTAGAVEADLSSFATFSVSHTSASGTFNLNGLFNTTNGSGNTVGHAQITDEIRVGTTLADVTYVPEPGAVTGLFSGAVILLVWSRIRRRHWNSGSAGSGAA